MLDSGIDPMVMPCPQDLLQEPGFSIGPFIKGYSFLDQAVCAHHFYYGIVFITSSVIGFRYHYSAKIPLFEVGNSTTAGIGLVINSWHAQLSMNLAIAGSFIRYRSDYPTVPLGAGAHASIFMLLTYYKLLADTYLC